MNTVVKKVRDLDAAAEAVRGFMGGKVKVAALGSHLDGLAEDELEIVSLATRVPLTRLKGLQKMSGQQMQLLTK